MTLFIPILPQMKKYFNSHAHVERDSIPPFQTEREGYFNSHAHVERDLIDNGSIIVTEISTHTLTWSVTGGELLSVGIVGFQLTRSRGA